MLNRIRKIITFMFSGITFFLFSCNDPNAYTNEFYNRKRDDAKKILPIHDPYYLSSIFNGPWKINLINNEFSSTPVDKMRLNEGYIWGFGKRGETYSVMQDEPVEDIIPYFVIAVDTHSELVTLDSIKYVELITKLELDNSIYYTKHQLDSIHNKFVETGKLPWYVEDSIQSSYSLIGRVIRLH